MGEGNYAKKEKYSWCAQVVIHTCNPLSLSWCLRLFHLQQAALVTCSFQTSEQKWLWVASGLGQLLPAPLNTSYGTHFTREFSIRFSGKA
jgi:hypothetical protein